MMEKAEKNKCSSVKWDKINFTLCLEKYLGANFNIFKSVRCIGQKKQKKKTSTEEFGDKHIRASSSFRPSDEEDCWHI